MVDYPEQSNIRGLDIREAVTGFADASYIFKSAISQATTKGDSIRWFQKTAAHLTAVTPMNVKNKAIMAIPAQLETSWTRNTSYIQEFMAEDTISEMDIQSAEISVFARMLQELVFSVQKQVDTYVWDTVTENRSPSTINSVTATAAWDAGSGQDPVEDILEALMDIEQYDYDTSSAELWISPKDKKSLLTWLISTKGASIPSFASQKVQDGVLMNFLGCKVRVSNNVTADYALVIIPSKAATWYSHTDITSAIIANEGLNKKIRVWQRGVCTLDNPRAVGLISNTQN